MLGRPLRYLSILLSLTVLAGFGLFAVDEMDGAPRETTVRIAGDDAASGTVSAERQLAAERLAGDATARPAAGGPAEADREARTGTVRGAIDDANDVLLSPFDGLVDGADDVWVRHGVPALLGLLLYGFVLGYGARVVSTRS